MDPLDHLVSVETSDLLESADHLEMKVARVHPDLKDLAETLVSVESQVQRDHQEATADLDSPDLQDHEEGQERVEPRATSVVQDSLDHQDHVENLVLKAPLALMEDQDLMDHEDLPDLGERPVLMDHLAMKAATALQDSAEALANKERQDPLDLLEDQDHLLLQEADGSRFRNLSDFFF